MRYLLGLFLFILVLNRVDGQCTLTGPTTLQDITNGRPDTTQLILQVEGAVFNDLSTSDQGVCAVNLQFKHPFMKELSIELISPSGQRVVLTGGTINAANTPFTQWLVTFVPCSASAAPDPGFSAFWENNQAWQSFKNYTGQYYPHSGCLEDFNAGPVTGNWTIRCIDNADQGKGVLLGATLSFCQDEGIMCSRCNLFPGSLAELDLSVCQGDPILRFLPETSFLPASKKDTNHLFSYAFFKDSIYFKKSSDNRMDTFPPGIYKMCPLENDSASVSTLPPFGERLNPASFQQYLKEKRLCAALSDSCIQVRITNVPDTISFQKMVCVGGEYRLFDSVFTQPGTYLVEKNQQACDTIVRLQLRHPNQLLNVVRNKPSLSCDTDTMQLAIQFFSDKCFLVSSKWSTNDGRILSERDSLMKLDKPGTYLLTYEVDLDGVICSDSASFQVTISGNQEAFSIIADTITCDRDSVVLLLQASPEIRDIQWYSPDMAPFQPISSGIKVWQPATFVAEGKTGTGCLYIDSVQVVADIDTLVPIVQTDTISCTRTAVPVRLLTPGFISVRYNGAGFVSSEPEPVITQPGTYTCTLTAPNGCTGQTTFTVPADTLAPRFVLSGSDFGCGQTQTTISFSSSSEYETVNWSGPQIAPETDTSAIVSVAGWYKLQIIAKNQCSTTDSFEIKVDTLSPEVMVRAPGPLTCRDTILNLTADSPSEIIRWHWSTGDSLSSSIQINEPGIYTVTVTNSNQCTGMKSIQILEDKPIPDVAASATIITCLNKQSLVKVLSVTLVDSILWDNQRNPFPVAKNDSTFLTTKDGIYHFTVVNKQGCSAEEQVQVFKDVSPPRVLSKILDTLSCTQPEVTLGVILDKDGVEFLWNGPEVYDIVTDSLLNVNKEGTYYLKITGHNSCIAFTEFEVIRLGIPPDLILTADSLTCSTPVSNISVLSSVDLISYAWTGPQGFQSTLPGPSVSKPGTYIVTVISKDSCEVSQSIDIVGDFSIPEIDVRDTFLLPCDGNGVLLMPELTQPALRYLWTLPGGQQVEQSDYQAFVPGRYLLEAEAQNGCRSQVDSIWVVYPENKAVYKVSSDTITCSNRTATLRIVDDIPMQRYLWQNSSGQVEEGNVYQTNIAGEIMLIVFDVNGCRDTSVLQIETDTMQPQFKISQAGDILCGNLRVELEATPQLDASLWRWNWTAASGLLVSDPDNSRVMVEGAGLYRVTAINTSNGCASTIEYQVTAREGGLSEIVLSGEDPTCGLSRDGQLEVTGLNGLPPYSVWLNGIIAPKGTLMWNGLSEGLYVVVVKDSLGCQVKDSLRLVNELTPGNSLVEIDQTILFGDSVQLTLPSGIPAQTAAVIWQGRAGVLCTGCSTLVVKPFINEVFTASVGVGTPCAYMVRYTIRVKNNIEDAIPNIFTPSGDANARFYIPQVRGIKEIVSLAIFDRWAENVFLVKNVPSGEAQFGWDGTFNGKEVEQGVYVVVAELVLEDGNVWKYRGDVTLLR